MIRTQLYLPEDLHRRLRALVRERGTTLSELVRQSLRRTYFETVDRDDWNAAVDSARGLWSEREDVDDDWARRIRSGSRRLDGVLDGDPADRDR
ncbi:MAG: CopG family transcriptional regulator [Polyangia bacterium]